ncbi:hypothetical protein [Plantactinospora sp. B24E8]|uniref:hypothetical protein n=1 Tax=Plantactinospora sp. B24E8 TaxID=3153567 RepID=UPI00325CFAD9
MPHREHADHASQNETEGGRSDEATSADRKVGRHRAENPRRSGRAWRRLRSVLGSGPVRFGSVAALTCCLGTVAFVESRAADTPAPPPAAPNVLAERRAAAENEAASRGNERAPSPTPSATGSPSPGQPTVRPTAARTRMTKAKRQTRPSPVAGLTQAQMDNAHAIVQTGVRLKVPRRGLVVAIATAMQESNLYNLANTGVPESLNYPNQGTGYDHDSVGLFQQRPSSGWGTVADLMRPAYAAEQFFKALLAIPGWQEMSVTGAAQAVQVSAFPDAYAQHETRATTVVGALV